MRKLLLTIALLMSSLAIAQMRVSNKGADAGMINNINCTGNGITCTRRGMTADLSVAGAAWSTLLEFYPEDGGCLADGGFAQPDGGGITFSRNQPTTCPLADGGSQWLDAGQACTLNGMIRFTNVATSVMGQQAGTCAPFSGYTMTMLYSNLDNNMWLAQNNGSSVYRVSMYDGGTIGNSATADSFSYGGIALATGDYSVWIAGATYLTKLNAYDGGFRAQYAHGFTGPRGLAYASGDDSVWALGYSNNVVKKFSASTGSLIGTYATGSGPQAIAYAPVDNSVWVCSDSADQVRKYSAYDGGLLGTFDGGACYINGIVFSGLDNTVLKGDYAGGAGKTIVKYNLDGGIAGVYDAGSGPGALTLDTVQGYVWANTGGGSSFVALNAYDGGYIVGVTANAYYALVYVPTTQQLWTGNGGSAELTYYTSTRTRDSYTSAIAIAPGLRPSWSVTVNASFSPANMCAMTAGSDSANSDSVCFDATGTPQCLVGLADAGTFGATSTVGTLPLNQDVTLSCSYDGTRLRTCQTTSQSTMCTGNSGAVVLSGVSDGGGFVRLGVGPTGGANLADAGIRSVCWSSTMSCQPN